MKMFSVPLLPALLVATTFYAIEIEAKCRPSAEESCVGFYLFSLKLV